jgi:hypothetical protein
LAQLQVNHLDYCPILCRHQLTALNICVLGAAAVAVFHPVVAVAARVVI